MPEETETKDDEKKCNNTSSAPTPILSSNIENLNDRTFKSEKSGDLNIKCQDVEKVNTNKTDNSNTENFNKTKKKDIAEFNSS